MSQEIFAGRRTVSSAPERTEAPGDASRTQRRKSNGLILLIILLLTVSGAIAMRSISGGPVQPWTQGAKSPNGYLISNVLFVLPTLALLVWLELNRKKFAPYHKAFWLTAAVILSLAVALDVFLGIAFFAWPNKASYVGLYIPGYQFGAGWTWDVIPIEEVVFYLTGIVFMLLCYIWGSASFVSAYRCDQAEYIRTAQEEKRLALFHPLPLILGVLVFLVVLVYKKFGNHPYHQGFPGYFMFLDLLVVVPSAMFYRTVGRFINFQAFLITTLLILMISLLWEGTLGLAYGWWNYRPEQMMGIFIKPWYGLPIEEIVTWSASAWMNVTVLEVMTVYAHSDRKAKHLLFGVGARR
jgi:hypothetical protein